MRELAAAAGVAEPTASRWANGKSTPSPDHWGSIEAFFELEPGSLGQAGVDLTRRLAQLEEDVQVLRELAQEVPALRDQVERLVRLVQAPEVAQ